MWSGCAPTLHGVQPRSQPGVDERAREAIGASARESLRALTKPLKLQVWAKENPIEEAGKEVAHAVNAVTLPLAGAGLARSLAGMAARGSFIDPKAVRFSQDSIKSSFRGGGSIDELAEGLRSGTIKPGDVPALGRVGVHHRQRPSDDAGLHASDSTDAQDTHPGPVSAEPSYTQAGVDPHDPEES